MAQFSMKIMRLPGSVLGENQHFNGRFRAECPNAHWFLTLADAVEKLEA